MCNNERVNKLIYDYTVKRIETLITMHVKEKELIEYQKYLVELAEIYTNSHMFDEALSLIKYIAYFDKCFIK